MRIIKSFQKPKVHFENKSKLKLHTLETEIYLRNSIPWHVSIQMAFLTMPFQG